jgi:tetratricopeptide (TPR) repeat protein
MIKLAKRIIEEKRENKDNLFFNAYLLYQEGDYNKALNLFGKINNDSAIYMKAIIHLRNGNFHEGITALLEYEESVAKWPKVEEKLDAIEQISRLKAIIHEKFLPKH